MAWYGDIAVLALFLFAFGLISLRISSTPLTAPILCTLFGWLAGKSGLNWIDLNINSEIVRILAELTLTIVLFNDAARIDLRLLRRNVGIPARLLGIGLPLTVIFGAFVAHLLFPNMGFWAVAILATTLSPTDAALGEVIVEHEEIPLRIRQTLNVESGLNDGLCVPILSILIAGALATGQASNMELAVKAIGYAIASGLLCGFLGPFLLTFFANRHWMTPISRRVAMILIPLIAFATSQFFQGSGFLAAFVSGLATGSSYNRHDEDQFEAADDAGDLLSLVTWFVFGTTFVPIAILNFTWLGLIYALLSLTIIRMLPVAISLIGGKFRPSTILLLGWFGPRGLASIVFGIMVLGTKGIAHSEEIGAIAALTVLLSIFAHGMTAAPIAHLFAKKSRSLHPEHPEHLMSHPLRTRHHSSGKQR